MLLAAYSLIVGFVAITILFVFIAVVLSVEYWLTEWSDKGGHPWRY